MPILAQKDKDSDSESLVLLVSLDGCETLTLNSDLKRRIDALGNKFFRRILGK